MNIISIFSSIDILYWGLTFLQEGCLVSGIRWNIPPYSIQFGSILWKFFINDYFFLGKLVSVAIIWNLPFVATVWDIKGKKKISSAFSLIYLATFLFPLSPLSFAVFVTTQNSRYDDTYSDPTIVGKLLQSRIWGHDGTYPVPTLVGKPNIRMRYNYRKEDK